MMNFACKNFRSIDIIKCGLGLTRAELTIFLHFLKNEEETLTANTLSNKVDLELTTVQKALKKMREKDLLEKNQVNLENGGYFFEYKIRPKSEIRRILKEIIRKWTEHIEKKVEKKDFFEL